MDARGLPAQARISRRFAIEVSSLSALNRGMPTSAPACALVIFGASGDLARRKLIPAIYEMAREKLLPDGFALVGYSRTEMSDEQYRAQCREALDQFARTKPVDEAIWKRLAP